MAVRPYTKDQAVTASMGDGSLIRIQWTALTFTTLDSGQPAPWAEWADRTFHAWATNFITGVVSVIGAGGNLILEGSNDYDPNTDVANATWAPLTSQTGTVLNTVTAVAIVQGTESPLWVRPRISAGDGTTSCNVILCARRIQPQIT